MIPIDTMNSMSLEVNCCKALLVDSDMQSMSPVDYVRCLIPAELEPKSERLSLDKTIAGEGYTMEVVGAIRSNDIAALRYMLENGQNFDVCNTNGEYLIHLACRRSTPEIVEFLINEAKVRCNVRDNMGRSVLHDVCWKSSPDFQMMSVVLKFARPELLLAKDIRGHSPFDFARKEHWKQWIHFLRKNQDEIQQRLFEQ